MSAVTIPLGEHQRAIQDHIDLHTDTLAAIQDSLSRATTGRPWDRAIVDGGTSCGIVWPRGWSDREKHPNAWACEQLAAQVADKSSIFAERGFRRDAGETLLFARMLTHYVAKAVPTLYIPNQVRAAFPVDSSYPAGADTISYRRIDLHRDGSKRPRSMSPQADDIPKVKLSAEELLHKVATYPLGISWSIEELERAVFANVPLQSMQLLALDEEAATDFEIVGLLGDTEKGFAGVYNQAGITIVPVVTGTWTLGITTHAQIVGDLQALLYGVKAASGNGRVPNRLWLPSTLWKYLFVRAGGGDPTTVLKAITNEFPGLQVVEIARADLYDASGTGPRIMAGSYDALAGSIIETMPFRLEAPQQRGFMWDLNGRQRLGGFQCVIPLLYGYMDGC